MIDADVAIVGAGPAGLAAAAEALARGLSVALLDDNALPGGQYFRQAPRELRRAGAADGREHRRAEALFRAIEHPRLRYLGGAVVWDAPGPGVLAFARGADSGRVQARAVVVASGAVERAVPFPGWTLPGVLTAGGVQNLIKSQRVLPGRRFLVAGNGPLLLVAAHSIVRAGGTVVEVAEGAVLARAWRHAPGLLAAPDVLRRGLGYRAALARAGVPVRSGQTIVAARGPGEVAEAVVAPIDPAGRVDRSRARAIAVDTVVAGFGLVPAVELTGLLGCRHRWDARRGGWFPSAPATSRRPCATCSRWATGPASAVPRSRWSRGDWPVCSSRSGSARATSRGSRATSGGGVVACAACTACATPSPRCGRHRRRSSICSRRTRSSAGART
jgi:NADPH-dependent 2,4-dienoyl-CoA reductase/sulfur reductase-like enzyme